MKLPEEMVGRIIKTIPHISIHTMYGPDAFVATCISSEDPDHYYTILMVRDLGEDGDRKLSCSCPQWRNKLKFCKHIWASLYVHENELKKVRR